MTGISTRTVHPCSHITLSGDTMEKTPGVEVILDEMETNPQCPHGPTLQFKRTVNGEEQRFYACSACRDRKDCNFYLRADEKWTEGKKIRWELKRKESLPPINVEELSCRLEQIIQLPPSQRGYCHTCSLLILPSEREQHSGHDLSVSVSNYLLKHPSELLKPLESAKKEAQYLFAHKSTRVLVNLLRGVGVRRVLCVGAPRVHELVQAEWPDMQSMLLDIDHRHLQFYTEEQFSWFNSFNFFWFLGERGIAAVTRFLEVGKANECAVVTDPPFGGRVEPLARTMRLFDKLHKDLHPDREDPLPVMWIFPYFMEPMVVSQYPDMSMLDYKVDYDNHPLFQEGEKGRKFGSPVRIFTNLRQSKLKLPAEDGYKHCEFCERWVSAENKHCFKCNACTSKNGRTYTHCTKCERCVKPSWTHCKKCGRCCLPTHECGSYTSPGCFACHQPGHKKSECPLRVDTDDGDGANRPRRKRRKSSKLKSSLHHKSSVNTFSVVSNNLPCSHGKRKAALQEYVPMKKLKGDRAMGIKRNVTGAT